MALAPWTQQPALAPGAEEKAPAKKFFAPWEKNWWEYDEPGGMGNWQNWLGGLGQASKLAAPALPFLSLGAGATSMLGQAAPTLGSALGQIPAWMSQHKGLSALGALGGYLGYQNLKGVEPEPAPMYGPEVPAGFTSPTVWPPSKPAPSTLPQPGEDTDSAGPEGKPVVITDESGQKFWWNPTGGIYGTGGWDTLPSGATGLTPEQQIEQAKLDREAAQRRTETSAGLTPAEERAELEAQRAHQAAMAEADRIARSDASAEEKAALIERLQMQLEYDRQAREEQATFDRERQAAAVAQQMANMYAADPYKYWAQLGVGTPEAVARLTGGAVAPGEQMSQVPLSVPSQQWWGNLLPSEQQQISGGLNWMGIDPNDWYSMKQRMIPGMSSRQVGPTWTR